MLHWLVIWLEARLRPNIGNTLWPVLMVFTCSAITTLPKVNRFGWNLEHSGYIVWGWPWQILGAILAVARAGEPGEIFCQISNARFYWFSVGQISQNLNTTQIGAAMNPFGTEFWQFFRSGRFSNTPKKWNFFQHLATSGHHNSAVITDRWKFITKIAIYRMSSLHFDH